MYSHFMQLPFFYQKEINLQQTQLVLNEETSKHCVQVLRMQQGEQLQITNGIGTIITTKIVVADKKNCIVKMLETTHLPPTKKQICIAISLLKNNSRFEWFLEKATEIGITEIIPIISKRTERQHFKLDRLNNILISAMLQSRQVFLPILHQPINYNDIINLPRFTTKLIAHCVEEKRTAIKEINISNNTLILIGPEGDFTQDEIQLALQQNYQPIILGNTRLRTETAGIVAATLLANN
jgi:16S rRNA (uracil1498-N3)-methyltransferase